MQFASKLQGTEYYHLDDEDDENIPLACPMTSEDCSDGPRIQNEDYDTMDWYVSDEDEHIQKVRMLRATRKYDVNEPSY